MPRLFVAVLLPDHVRRTLAALPGRFDGAKWVEPDNLHVTVRFIGEVNTETAAALESALASVSAPAFDLTIAGVGSFPSSPRRPPRVLWAGLSRTDGLVSLYEMVQNALHAHVPPDASPYTPHVTLARLKSDDDQTIRRAREFLERHAGLQSDTFRVDTFHLMRSTLTPAGPEYSSAAAYVLEP